MPVAIVFAHDGVIPAILYEETPAQLVAALAALAAAPNLQSEDEARLWLQRERPAPSGWFATIDEAKAHIQRWKEETPPLTKDEVRAAREKLGMTQAEFADALGIGGNRETQRRYIAAVEKGEIQKKTNTPRVLSVTATQQLRALMAEHGLDLSSE